jgi:hypothetical protein
MIFWLKSYFSFGINSSSSPLSLDLSKKFRVMCILSITCFNAQRVNKREGGGVVPENTQTKEEEEEEKTFSFFSERKKVVVLS